jgi:hypothetical protein
MIVICISRMWSHHPLSLSYRATSSCPLDKAILHIEMGLIDHCFAHRLAGVGTIISTNAVIFRGIREIRFPPPRRVGSLLGD